MADLNAMAVEWKRERVAELLSHCTERQQEFFHRLYPDGPRPDQLANAYNQIERTLKKNAAALKTDGGDHGE